MLVWGDFVKVLVDVWDTVIVGENSSVVYSWMILVL